MYFFRCCILLVILATPSWCAVHQPRDTEAVDLSNKYIIVLKPDVDTAEHLAEIERLHVNSQVKRSSLGLFDGVSEHFNVSDTFYGYAGHFDKDIAQHLKSHPDVDSIEPNSFHTLGLGGYSTQKKAPYGLWLISNHGQSDDYIYDDSAGAGTTAYIISSGINTEHKDLQGRASDGYNAFKDGRSGDSTGIGTHLAAIVGGKTYGVAKKTNLVSVKVFKNTRTDSVTLLRGIVWAGQRIIEKNQMAKAVILTPSLVREITPSLRTVLKHLEAHDISVVMGADSTAVVKRGEVFGLVVGATDKYRKRARFSSGDSGVSIFAPGVDIVSAWSGSPTAKKYVSGTSQAAAFVAGLVVYFKAFNNWADARKTKAGILKRALPNQVEAPGQALNLFADNAMGLRAG